MQINIYKDKMQKAYLFGTPVLYSEQPIPREDVPHGWYCYDLRGTAEDPRRPCKLVDQAEKNHAGSVLSRLPLKNGRSQSRLVKDEFQLTAASATLNKFCSDENIQCPETPIHHQLRPASPEEAGLFYAQTPERDMELGAIGHVRIDFGSGGKGFHHTWWPRGPAELNTQEFRDELDKVVNDLRKSVLKSLGAMNGFCCNHGGSIEGGACCQNYGYVLETERYTYRLRCNPIEGDYQAYLSCFDKQAQQMGLTEQGRLAIQNAAVPTLPHSYEWYVIDRLDSPDLRRDYEVPLEEAIQIYAGLGGAHKRLGVTKASIAAVDLVICLEGREWLSDDWRKLDSFKDDPIAAAAVSTLQAELDVKPLVGRVTFASGERIGYTDPEEYIRVIREELPYQPASGFRYETLTGDPKIRKQVDDILYDLYGEENPRTLKDYNGMGMTIGGMQLG